MPVYVYGCSQDHPTFQIRHGFDEEYNGMCQFCGEQLHRIPQPFSFYLNPLGIIREWSEKNWSKYLRKEPRDYYNVSSEKGIPQKDYGARK